VHKNIEKVVAARAVKNEGASMRMKELLEKGKAQLAAEERQKRKKKRSKEEREAVSLANAQKRLEGRN